MLLLRTKEIMFSKAARTRQNQPVADNYLAITGNKIRRRKTFVDYNRATSNRTDATATDHPTFTLLGVPVLNMLQFTQRFWRLETMKISKFVWLVLVAFATVASIAPQQAEAIIVDGRVGGQTVLSGSGTITESNPITSNGITSNGINSNGINELDFNGQFFPHGPLPVTGATDDFIPILGSQATFNLAIRWTGSGSSVTLLDVLSGGGPAWSSPITGANGFATGTFFSLKSVTFDEDSLTLIGRGTTQLISGDPLVLKHSAASIVIQGTGQDFTYNLTVVTTAVPEGGSGLGLLAIGLVGLVAVEGLRRKIATRQNRYA
jgi:hypothetical protein